MRAFAILIISLALLACVPSAFAADRDFNGRWDLTVKGMTNCTITCAWWLEVIGAGTPEIKGSFVGLSDGSLRELANATIKDGVLHFILGPEVRNGGRRPVPPGAAPEGGARVPGPPPKYEYEARYVNGKLEGAMHGGRNNYTFTGVRMPVIDEHDDGTWVKGEPIVLFNGKDLSGWHGMMSETPAGWKVEDGILGPPAAGTTC